MKQKVTAKSMKSFLLDALAFIIGSLIYSVSVNSFTAPNFIAPGGATGIATMLNYLLDTPIGTMIFIINIPIFIWGLAKVGYKFIIKTIFATLLMSAAIDLTSGFLPIYKGDMLITIVCSGFLSGLGLALIFIRGGTTGGTDLAAILIGKRFRHLSLGRLILVIDLLVVAISSIVFKGFETALYAVLIIFITTKVIDSVLYGISSGTGKIMFIISDKNIKIANEILRTLSRGVTELKSRGSYSGKDGEVLLCAVRRHEVHKTYDIIHTIDPSAFVIVGEAVEITGEGFMNISTEKKS